MRADMTKIVAVGLLASLTGVIGMTRAAPGTDAVLPLQGTVTFELPQNLVTLQANVFGNSSPIDPQQDYVLFNRNAPGGPSRLTGRLAISSVSVGVSSDGPPAATEISIIPTDCAGSHYGEVTLIVPGDSTLSVGYPTPLMFPQYGAQIDPLCVALRIYPSPGHLRDRIRATVVGYLLP